MKKIDQNYLSVEAVSKLSAQLGGWLKFLGELDQSVFSIQHEKNLFTIDLTIQGVNFRILAIPGESLSCSSTDYQGKQEPLCSGDFSERTWINVMGRIMACYAEHAGSLDVYDSIMGKQVATEYILTQSLSLSLAHCPDPHGSLDEIAERLLLALDRPKISEGQRAAGNDLAERVFTSARKTLPDPISPHH